MQALEFETQIGDTGTVQLPIEYWYAYGKSVRLLVLLPEQADAPPKRRQPGSAKGLLKVLHEDNEHLQDFEERHAV